ncbi:MAG: VTT domain-containing protein [Chlorobium phaeobacteroides]|uniref:SNARE associated Golgi protein n=1 Tax=Chlorobium phaeobacteroides (strain BS1) TaxID=331678 RepID=B3EQL1_CHLPB|nr:VTT domain-containing protein [Chlorobium phaeobacteroides]
MLESIIEYLRSADPAAVYLFLFFISFLENVVPPVPGDVPVAFIGYLSFSSDIDFWFSVAFASAGSTLGFMVMFLLSRTIGLRIYSRGESRLRHGVVRTVHRMFPPDLMERARLRFTAHGYFAVLINRFLFGYRAIISVMAGFMHLHVSGVFFAALASSLIWYVLLLSGGYFLGENWQEIGAYMALYSIPLSLVFLCIIIIGIVRYRRAHAKG